MPGLFRTPVQHHLSVIALLTASQLALHVSGAVAQSQTSADVATEAASIFSSTMSPFCPGMTLEVCPSSQAAALKDSIREWLTEGKDRKWVTDHLYELYGDQIRAAPAFEGFGIVGWLLPGVLIVVLAVVIVIRFRRLPDARPHTFGASLPDALDDAEEEEVRRALAELGT